MTMMAQLSGFTGATLKAYVNLYDAGGDDTVDVMATQCLFIEKVA